MSWSRPDDSIENEPHLREHAYPIDPSERAAAEALNRQPLEIGGVEVEHTVWDEPTAPIELAGPPGEDQVTYARWLVQKIAATPYEASLFTTAALVLLAGPWGIFGALWEGMTSGSAGAGILAVVVFGPVTEEIMKIALALWIVEKRPYLFKSIWQILVAAAAGGLMFGVIENLMYLNVYVPGATLKLARFRWTVCTGLHISCSFVAGVGVARIWVHTMRTHTPPHLGRGMPWFATAMLGHGLYNLFATVAQSTGWLNLE
jgi:hypothetical protein